MEAIVVADTAARAAAAMAVKEARTEEEEADSALKAEVTSRVVGERVVSESRTVTKRQVTAASSHVTCTTRNVMTSPLTSVRHARQASDLSDGEMTDATDITLDAMVSANVRRADDLTKAVRVAAMPRDVSLEDMARREMEAAPDDDRHGFPHAQHSTPEQRASRWSRFVARSCAKLDLWLN